MAVPTTGVDSPTPPPPDSGPSTRRERVGWYFYDWANSAFSTTVISVFLGPYLTHIAETAAACPPAPRTTRLPAPEPGVPRRRAQRAAGLDLPVRRLALGPPAGGRAAGDRRHRRPVVDTRSNCWPCSPTSDRAPPSDWSSSPASRWLLGAGLFILANIAFGASIVVYNSFLTQLARPDDRDAVSSRRLGDRVHRRRPAAAVQPGRDHHRRGRRGHGRDRAVEHRLGRRVVGGVHHPAADHVAQPAGGGRRGDRQRADRRVQAARSDPAPPDGVQADALLPDRVPDLQRRHPDRHHAGQHLRQPRS